MKGVSCVKKIFILMISICLFLGITTCLMDDPTKFTIHEPFQYSILPGTGEWKNFNSLEEKINACHIPQEILDEMDTKCLVESVINYPLLGNIHFFSTRGGGYQSVRSYFDGLVTLETRSDAGDCLYDYLMDIKDLKDVDMVTFWSLEVIIAQPVFYDSLSIFQKAKVEKHIGDLYELSGTDDSFNVFKQARSEYK